MPVLVQSCALSGIDARMVEVEVELGGGLPHSALLGSAGAVVREGLARVSDFSISTTAAPRRYSSRSAGLSLAQWCFDWQGFHHSSSLHLAQWAWSLSHRSVTQSQSAGFFVDLRPAPPPMLPAAQVKTCPTQIALAV